MKFIVSNVQRFDTVKKIWNSLERMYSQKHNVSRSYKLFERTFNTKQGSKYLVEHYGTLKELWEELLLY